MKNKQKWLNWSIAMLCCLFMLFWQKAAAFADNEQDSATITFNAGDGKFIDGSETNTVIVNKERGEKVERFSHTRNVDDRGYASTTYGNNESYASTVCIPGAEKLYINLTYGTENIDKISVYQGAIGNTALYTFSGGGSTKQSTDFTINGDTVSFKFTSDGSITYYGYYAVISNAPGNRKDILSGEYDIPFANNTEKSFIGWSLTSDGDEDELIDWKEINYDAELYAKYDIVDSEEHDWWSLRENGELLIGNGTDITIRTSEETCKTWPWYEYRNNIKSVRVVGNISFNGPLTKMFYKLDNVTNFNLSGLNVKNATDMSYMFYECKDAKRFNFSGWETGNVTSMAHMFDGCESVTSLDLSDFTTSNVLSMNNMFICEQLQSLNIASFNTKNVTDFTHFIDYCSNLYRIVLGKDFDFLGNDIQNSSQQAILCQGIKSVGWDLNEEIFHITSENLRDNFGLNSNVWAGEWTRQNWWDIDLETDTLIIGNGEEMVLPISASRASDWPWYNSGFSSVRFDGDVYAQSSIQGMFCNSGLREFNGINFHTENVEDMSYLFQGNSSLVDCDISTWQTPSLTNTYGMFASCNKLKTLNIENFDTRNLSNSSTQSFLTLGQNLASITLGKNVRFGLYYLPCNTSKYLGWSRDDGRHQVISSQQFSTMFDENSETYAGTWIQDGQWWSLSEDGELTIGYGSEMTIPIEYASSSSWGWDGNRSQIKSIKFTGKVHASASCDYMFTNCNNLQEVNWTGFDTSRTQTFRYFLSSSTKLEEIDISQLDFSSATSFDGMFSSCSSLRSFSFDGIDASKVNSLLYMFSGCNNLETLDLSDLNTSSATNLSNFFPYYGKLCSVILGENFSFKGNNITDTTKMALLPPTTKYTGWKKSDNTTSSMSVGSIREQWDSNKMRWAGEWVPDNQWWTITDDGDLIIGTGDDFTIPIEISSSASWPWTKEEQIKTVSFIGTVHPPENSVWWMFNYLPNLESADLTNLDMSAITSIGTIFVNCPKLRYVNFENAIFNELTVFAPFSNASSYYEMTVNLKNVKMPKVTSFNQSFYNIVREINMDGLYAPNVTNLSQMFYSCPNLQTISFDNVTLGAVTNMQNMFSGCNSLTSCDFGNLSIGESANMSYAFSNCTSLTNVNMKDMQCENGSIANTTYMFLSCRALKEITLCPAQTSAGANISHMFSESGITNVVWNNFDTGNASDMSYMFSSCPLTSINLNSLDLSSMDTMAYLFYKCSSLRSVEMNELDVSHVKNISYLFYNCSNLRSVNLNTWQTSQMTSMHYAFYYCEKLFELDISSWVVSNNCSISNFINASKLSSLTIGSGFKFKTSSSSFVLNTPDSNYTTKNWIKSDASAGPLTPAQLRDQYTANASEWAGTWVWGGYDPSGDWWRITDEGELIIGTGDEMTIPISGGTNTWSTGWPWSPYHYNITSVSFDGIVHGSDSLQTMFSQCTALETIDFTGLDTSNVQKWGAMFYNCNSLTELDLSGLSTESLNNIVDTYYSWGDRYDYGMFQGCAKLKSINFGNSFDTSRVTDFTLMFAGCSQLQSIDLNALNTDSATCTYQMFKSCSSLTSLDFSNINTQNVTNMAEMFYGCSKLTELNVSNLRTGKATNMSRMFYGCSNLAALSLENFDTSNVTNMSDMFDGCQSLSTISLNTWNVEKVTSVGSMFHGCQSLQSINLSNWNTSSLTNIRYYYDSTYYGMFEGCAALTEVHLDSFDTSKISDFRNMFKGCSSLESLNLSNFDTSAATVMTGMFSGCSSLNSVTLPSSFSFKGNNITNTSNMSILPNNKEYWGWTKVGSDIQPLIGWDLREQWDANKDAWAGTWVLSGNWWRITEEGELIIGIGSEMTMPSFQSQTSWPWHESRNSITSVSFNGTVHAGKTLAYMLSDCANLSDINWIGFDTTQATSMESMFNGCSNLTSLDLSGFITSNVTNFSYMLNDCAKLQDCNLSSFDTFKSTTFNNMFAGCSKIERLDLTNFCTDNVKGLSYMFYNCKSLYQINVSTWNVSNVTNFSYMFDSCVCLSKINLENFNTASLKECQYMFRGCTQLSEINLRNFDTRNQTNTYYRSNMFDKCNNIQKLTFGENIKLSNTTLPSISSNSVGWIKDDNSLGPMESSDLCTNQSNNQVEYAGTWIRGEQWWRVTDGGELLIGTGKTIWIKWTSESWPWTGLANIKSASFIGQVYIRDSMKNFFNPLSSLAEIDFTGLHTDNVTSMEAMLAGCKSLKTINFGDLNTQNVTSLSYMFSTCSVLTDIDMRSFDTANVKNFYAMFYNCSALRHVDLSNFDTSAATNANIFYNSSITSFTVSEKFRFAGNGSTSSKVVLPTVDSKYYLGWRHNEDDLVLSGTELQNSFDSRASEYAGTWSMSKWWDLSSDGTLTIGNGLTMTIPITGLTYSPADSNGITQNGQKWPWYSQRTSIKKVCFIGTVNAGQSVSAMFTDASNMTSVDLTNLHTDNTADFSAMFNSCSKISELDFEDINTSSATSMRRMFYDCYALTQIDCSGFSTSNVKDFYDMFYYCYNLLRLDISNFDTRSATNTYGMFYYLSSCKEITLGENFRFQGNGITSTNSMAQFYTHTKNQYLGWKKADGSTLPLTANQVRDQFDTNPSYYAGTWIAAPWWEITNSGELIIGTGDYMQWPVTTANPWKSEASRITSVSVIGTVVAPQKADSMFASLTNLTSADLRNLDTGNTTSMTYLFSGDSNLMSANLSELDMRSATTDYSYSMFNDCSKLRMVTLGPYFRFYTSSYTYSDPYGRLPTPPTNSQYSGYWIKSDGSKGPYSAYTIQHNYNRNAAAYAGTWVWETSSTCEFTFRTPDNIYSYTSTCNVKSDYYLPTSFYSYSDKKFIGWTVQGTSPAVFYSTAHDAPKIPANTYSVGDSVTFIATYEDMFRIFFVGEEGTSGEMEPISGFPSNAVQLPACTFTKQSRGFDYWEVVGSSPLQTFEDKAIIPSNTFTSGAEITLMAKFAPQYTIKFTAGDEASGDMSDEYCQTKRDYTVPGSAYEMAKGTFLYWELVGSNPIITFNPNDTIQANTYSEGDVITLKAIFEKYGDVKYSVSLWGIEQDVDKDGYLMGLTFGPAIGKDNRTSSVSHTPTGSTKYNHAHRCIHNDDWETIVYWNTEDPWVYEQCLGTSESTGCTKSIEMNLSSKLSGEGFSGNLAGDGVGAIYDELIGDSVAMYGVNNRFKWVEYMTDEDANGGWKVSNIRAVLNGVSEDTLTSNAAYLDNITPEESIFGALPEVLQNAIGEKQNISGVAAGSSETEITYDKLWLPSASELGSQAALSQGAKYEIFINEDISLSFGSGHVPGGNDDDIYSSEDDTYSTDDDGDYDFIGDNDSDYQTSSGSGFRVQVKRSESSDKTYSRLENVYMDDDLLSGSDYSVYDCSDMGAVIVFSDEFMDELETGQHTLSVSFTDGTATMTFVVLPSEDDDEYTSGDDTYTSGDDTYTNGDDAYTNNDDIYGIDDDSETVSGGSYGSRIIRLVSEPTYSTLPAYGSGREDDGYSGEDDAYASDDDSYQGNEDDTYTNEDDNYTDEDDNYTNEDDNYTNEDDNYQSGGDINIDDPENSSSSTSYGTNFKYYYSDNDYTWLRGVSPTQERLAEAIASEGFCEYREFDNDYGIAPAFSLERTDKAQIVYHIDESIPLEETMPTQKFLANEPVTLNPIIEFPLGYTFINWNERGSEPTVTYGNQALIAAGTYSPGDIIVLDAITRLQSGPIVYTVNYYHAPVDKTSTQWILAETEDFTVSPYDEVTPVVKSYPGFISPEPITRVIDSTGIVISYYYTRQYYVVVFNGNGDDLEYYRENYANYDWYDIDTLEKNTESGTPLPNYIPGVEMPCGTLRALPENMFVRYDGVFENWNIAQDGSGASYSDKQSVKDLASPNQIAVLYAQWALNPNIQTTTEEGDVTVKIKQGETAVIPGISAGTSYSIDETELPNGFHLDSVIENVDGGDAVISPNTTNRAVVVNEYSSEGLIPIEAHVKVIGGQPSAGEFNFSAISESLGVELRKTNGSIDKAEYVLNKDGETVVNPWYGTSTIRFDDSTVSEEGVYDFIVGQIPGNNESIQYDTHVEKVRVVVTDNGNGTMSADVQYDEDGPLFINRYKAAGNLEITKEILNATEASENQRFSFQINISDSDGVPMDDEFDCNIYQKMGDNENSSSEKIVLHTANLDDEGNKLSDFDENSLHQLQFYPVKMENAENLKITIYSDLYSGQIYVLRGHHETEATVTYSDVLQTFNAPFSIGNPIETVVPYNEITIVYYGHINGQDCYGMFAEIEPAFMNTVGTQIAKTANIDENGNQQSASIGDWLINPRGHYYCEKQIDISDAELLMLSVKSGGLSADGAELYVLKGLYTLEEIFADTSGAWESDLLYDDYFQHENENHNDEEIVVPGNTATIIVISRSDVLDNGYGYGLYVSADGVTASNLQRVRSVKVKDGSVVEFAANELARISGLPFGTKYSIEEQPTDGWELLSSSGASGVLGEMARKASFTNSYSAKGEVSFHASQELIGGIIEPDAFNYEVKNEAGETVGVASVRENGSILFNTLDYAEGDDGKEYHYYISQIINDNITDMIMDDSVKEVRVILNDNGKGQIATTVMPVTDLVFRNVKLVDLTVKNSVRSGENLEDDVFDYTIVLKDSSGEPYDLDLTNLEGVSPTRGIGTYTFSLSNGESKTFTLPSDTSFDVTQENEGFKTKITMTEGGNEVSNPSSPPKSSGIMNGVNGNIVVNYFNSTSMVLPTGILGGKNDGIILAITAGALFAAGVFVMKRSKKKKEAVSE